MGIKIKSVHEAPETTDGYRCLIEQFIPDGMREDDLQLSGWFKNLAPSVELKALLSDNEESSWKEFRRLYYQELLDPSKEHNIHILTEKAKHGEVTLVFDVINHRRNHAIVLKTLIELRMRIDENF